MRVSLAWVARLLGRERLGIATDDLVERLTRHLAEIDGVERTGPVLEGVVVGRVETVRAHPDADRLRCTTVDVGNGEPLPIVCGAPNVAAGLYVPVALPGATLTTTDRDGTPRTLTIKKGKLRSEPSHGMICAEDELGLGDDHSGIMVLDGEPIPGTPLADVVAGGDEVLVVDNHNINHRPDLWGQLGWAREIAALLGLPPPPEPDLAWDDHGPGLELAVEDERCTAYRGTVITGVHNGPSPDWMQQLLLACGVRPLGLLVDATNYVMLELGEPTHAFDRRELRGDRIVVRAARAGEVLETLDGRERELDADDLVIADAERPLALAGIMGGEDSGVGADTTEIVLEAGTFAAAAIRRSRIRHGLVTDSSLRFEKHLNPELTAAASNRLVELLRECCPGCEVVARFAHAPATVEPLRLPFDADAAERLLGIAIPEAEQRRSLEALGFALGSDGVTVPWWRRRDVAESVDLVEEVGRLHGYDRIAAEVPRLPAASPADNPLRDTEHRCRRLLSGLGWDEVQTYAFTSTAWAEALGWPEEAQIHLAHPLASDQSVLRCELLPTLLEAVGRNRRFLDAVALYEIGRRYQRGCGRGSCADETLVLTGVWCATGDDVPFYAARDAALGLLDGLGYTVTVVADDAAHPAAVAGRSARILFGSDPIGAIAELPAELRSRADVDGPCAWFSVGLERLLADHGVPAPQAFASPSRFQQVTRDFTFLCPEHLSFADLANAASSGGKGLVRAVDLAQPVYRGDQIPPDHKAVSVRVALQSDTKTLGDKDLQKASKGIVGAVERQTPARLRA